MSKYLLTLSSENNSSHKGIEKYIGNKSKRHNDCHMDMIIEDKIKVRDAINGMKHHISLRMIRS